MSKCINQDYSHFRGVMELLKNLIKTEPTPDNGEIKAAQVLSDYFKSFNLDPEIDCWETNRANITLHIRSDSSRKGLLFGSHLDVVPPGDTPWDSNPFDPVEKNGRIYGRGTADMKGGTAAAAMAIAELAREGFRFKGDLIYSATAGEETDSAGVKRFAEVYKDKIPSLAGIVVPEPTDFSIVSAHRGMLWLEITTLGQTAHGSMPHEGVNAISKMNRLIGAIENFNLICEPEALLGAPTISINQISAGNAPNVIPDQCTITVDIRLVPKLDAENAIVQIEGICKKLQNQDPEFKYEIETIRTVPAMKTETDNDFVSEFCQITGVSKTTAVGYTTDGPYFKQLHDCPVLIYGPGKCEACHKPNEYIDIQDVTRAKEEYKRIIRHFLG